MTTDELKEHISHELLEMFSNIFTNGLPDPHSHTFIYWQNTIKVDIDTAINNIVEYINSYYKSKET